MKNRRILSLIFFISGLTFSGIVLFADVLGLDDHSGWGRTRLLGLIAGGLLAACSLLYLGYQAQAESAIEGWIIRLDRNSLTSRFLNLSGKYFFTLPLALLVILVYIWLVSSGTWTHWVSPTRYYADLARGFANGNLFMATKVDPRLSELADPYNPVTRQDIDTPIDVSYYNGRYYLYWGPVPSLILLPVQQVFHGRVGDLQLTFAFTCGIFLLLYVLLVVIWETHFSELPKWLLGTAILVTGLSNPVLFMLNNFKGARIYEAAITGGQFFLIAGLLVIMTTFGKSASYWKPVLAGSLWALSIGTRFFLILPIFAVVLVILYMWFVEKTDFIEKGKRVFVLGLPLLLGLVAIGWYNWARFGSVTESGLYYQLAGQNLQRNYDILIQPVYLLQNVYNYFLHSFGWSTAFPFITVEYGRTSPLFASYPLPSFYSSQQTTGLLFSVPFVLFSLIPLIWLIRTHRHPNDHSFPTPILMIFFASFGAAALFLMCFFWSAMRYLEDFMPSLLILSMIGFWQGYKFFTSRSGRSLYLGLGILLAAASLSLSLLLAISINDVRFEFIHLFNFL